MEMLRAAILNIAPAAAAKAGINTNLPVEEESANKFFPFTE